VQNRVEQAAFANISTTDDRDDGDLFTTH